MRRSALLSIWLLLAHAVLGSGCSEPRCGDGRRDPFESCDLGELNSDTGECTTRCRVPSCGDGHVQAAEACDDGNRESGDGCEPTCNVCGDGMLHGAETCDDGNDVPGDGCTSCRQAGEVIRSRADGAGLAELLVEHDGGLIGVSSIGLVRVEMDDLSWTLLAGSEVTTSSVLQAGVVAPDGTLIVWGYGGLRTAQLARIALDGTALWAQEIPTDPNPMRHTLVTGVHVRGADVFVSGWRTTTGFFARLDLGTGEFEYLGERSDPVFDVTEGPGGALVVIAGDGAISVGSAVVTAIDEAGVPTGTPSVLPWDERTISQFAGPPSGLRVRAFPSTRVIVAAQQAGTWRAETWVDDLEGSIAYDGARWMSFGHVGTAAWFRIHDGPAGPSLFDFRSELSSVHSPFVTASGRLFVMGAGEGGGVLEVAM